MNVKGTISKLERNLDKIGMLAGGYGTLKQFGDPWDVGSKVIGALFEDPHIPDIQGVINALTKWAESKVFMPAVKAAVIGYVLKEINIHPQVNRIARALQNGGIGMAKGAAITTLVMYSGYHHSRHPPEGGSSGGNSETWRYQA